MAEMTGACLHLSHMPWAGWLRCFLIAIVENQGWKQIICMWFHKFLLALFSVVALITASDMVKLRITDWGHFQSPDIGRVLIRAINAVTVQHHRKIQPDEWWHCQILTSFRTLITFKRIAPVCNVIPTALGFPGEPWLLPTLFSQSDSNWLFVLTAAPDCWSIHAPVRAQSKSRYLVVQC